ncbi:MAG TPA: hypothetical protein VFB62_06800 [Polyangiaceae bacterium]|nr:hypothetical protein [Polyangiaceae bacterium]
MRTVVVAFALLALGCGDAHDGGAEHSHCNVMHLDAETLNGPAAFEDRGGNRRGCGASKEACSVRSAGPGAARAARMSAWHIPRDAVLFPDVPGSIAIASAERMPRLEAPFAILGAVVGWTSARFLENPWVGVSSELNVTLAMTFGALGGALLGFKLRSPAFSRRRAAGLYAMRWVAGLGIMMGALLGALSVGDYGLMTGAMVGSLCGLASAPLCSAVLYAARAAERARLGSIVAFSDRRAVWGMLAAAAALVSLAALPDLPAWRGGTVSFPWLSTLAAIGALLVVYCEVRQNREALRSLESLLENARPRDDDRVPHADVPRVDLGLGNEMHSQVMAEGVSYRGADREVGLIVGAAAEVRAALARALRWANARLALTVLVVLAHAIALNGHIAFAYHDELCDRHDRQACSRAAWLLHDIDGDGEAVASLHGRGCMGGDIASCARLSSLIDTTTGSEAARRAETGLYESCLAGVSPACCALARTPRADFQHVRSAVRRCGSSIE